MAVTRGELEGLTPAEGRRQWGEVLQRPLPDKGQRGAPFTAIEQILSYAALFVVAPSSQGGSDWGRYHPVLQQIGAALRRSPASIANKGANLIGTRANAQIHERELYAALGAGELPFPSLYATVMTAARESGVGPAELPDFLDLLGASDEWRALFLGDEELSRQDLEKAVAGYIDAAVDGRTTKEVLADIRIGQSRFARNVLAAFDHRCGFCGLDGRPLAGHRLTIASHIKPWSVASVKERLDARNGVAACPTHDAAFDTGLLTIDATGMVRRAGKLREAMVADVAVAGAFHLRDQIVAAAGWMDGRAAYLQWHRAHVWVNHDLDP